MLTRVDIDLKLVHISMLDLGNPISSLVSRNAVSTMSLSPASILPPGKLKWKSHIFISEKLLMLKGQQKLGSPEPLSNILFMWLFEYPSSSMVLSSWNKNLRNNTRWGNQYCTSSFTEQSESAIMALRGIS